MACPEDLTFTVAGGNWTTAENGRKLIDPNGNVVVIGNEILPYNARYPYEE
jgi:hypothetical protein